MPRVKFYINGLAAQALYTEALAPLAQRLQAQTERISHVEPCSLVLRGCFHGLRQVFGEDGRVGRWLRTWPCRWRVNFAPIGGGVFEKDPDGKAFADRAAAISFEIPLAVAFIQEGRIPC